MAAVRGISYQVRAGEVLGIVGESGSGKSVSSLAIMGLLPANARVTGSVRFRERDLMGLSDRELSDIRGRAHLDDFPGPAVGAHARLHRRRSDRRGGSGSQRRDAAGGACAGRRIADARGNPERRAAGVGVSARVFGWHAPARDDCDGDGQPARRDHRRRTDDRARRDDPGADSRRAQDGQRGDRRGDCAHHARPGCRRRIRRPCRRDVRGPHRRNWRCGRCVLSAADAVHAGIAGIDSAARRRTQAAAHANRWKPALARAPAVRMPILAAMPAANREVSGAGARAAADPGTRSLAPARRATAATKSNSRR